MKIKIHSSMDNIKRMKSEQVPHEIAIELAASTIVKTIETYDGFVVVKTETGSTWEISSKCYTKIKHTHVTGALL